MRFPIADFSEKRLRQNKNNRQQTNKMINWQEKMMDYLQGNLNEADELAFKNYLQTDEQAQNELEELKNMYLKLEEIPVPEPSEKLNANFWAMVEKEKTSQQKALAWQEKVRGFWANLWQNQWFNRLAYSILLIGIGFGGGYWLNQKNAQVAVNQGDEKMAELVKQMNEMKEMMMLTLIEKQSASERLQAVSMSTEIPNVDEKVIDALLKTLNNDENENVRLATVESLVELAENPKVREGLIKSINHQESPLVQIALVDAMLALQEKKSVSELKKLLQKKDLNEAVKGKIENSIKVLL